MKRRTVFLVLTTWMTGCATPVTNPDGSSNPDGGRVDGTSTGDGSMGGDAACRVGAPDEPDPAGFDANCDGIDGDLMNAIFVAPSGMDSRTGTSPDQALRSLKAALLAATRTGRTQVLVAVGNYTETMTLRMVEGVGIYGGYDPLGSWVRTSVPSVVQGASVALEAVGVTRPTRISRITIKSADGTMPGEASIALRAEQATGLLLEDNAVFEAGHGGVGTDGTTGSMGTMGMMGQPGIAGSIDSDRMPGGGGNAGENPSCPTARGGNGGSGGFVDNSFAGVTGAQSMGGTAGGGGGSTSSCTAANGTVGGSMSSTTLTRGGAGTGGGAVGTFDMTSRAYVPARGVDGQSGTSGAGGGGGGGSSGQTGSLCLDGSGNGGGGGGAGGCGGTGGTGGGGGGASVAVFSRNSGFRLSGVTLRTAGGGAGGAGGAGGRGGTGADGGAGNSAGSNEIGTGGRGGRGQDGSEGGAGGGGGGGPSIGLWVEGAAPTADAVMYQLGDGGQGGSSPAGTTNAGQNGKKQQVGP